MTRAEWDALVIEHNRLPCLRWRRRWQLRKRAGGGWSLRSVNALSESAGKREHEAEHQR